MLRPPRPARPPQRALRENNENAPVALPSPLLRQKQPAVPPPQAAAATAGAAARSEGAAAAAVKKALRRRDREAPLLASAKNGPGKLTPLAHTPERSRKAAHPTEGNRTGVLSVKQVNIQSRPAEGHPASVYNVYKGRPARQVFLADDGRAPKPASEKLVPVDLRKALASVAAETRTETGGLASRKKVAFSEPACPGLSEEDSAVGSPEDKKEAAGDRAQAAGRLKMLEPQVFPHTEEEVEYRPPRAKELPWDPGFEVDFTPLLKPPDSDLYYLPRMTDEERDGHVLFTMEGALTTGYGDAGYDSLSSPDLSDIDAAAARIPKEDYIFFDAIKV